MANTKDGRYFYKRISNTELKEVTIEELEPRDIANIQDYDNGKLVFCSKFFEVTSKWFYGKNNIKTINTQWL